MTLLETILSSTLIASVVVALIAWARNHKKDTAVAVKTGAEAETEVANAAEKYANAQVKIADAALEWAEKLNIELDKMRNICDRQKTELDETWGKLRNSQDKISEQHREIGRITETLSLMEKRLDTEKRQCEKITNDLYDLIKILKQNGTKQSEENTT